MKAPDKKGDRMSIYRCGMCDEYKDADQHGCFEHPNDEFECICNECDDKVINGECAEE